MIKFTIPVAPRTKKNSQRIFVRNGRPFIRPSKAYEKFEVDCLRTITGKYRLGIDYPVNIKAIYHVDRRNKVDITNLESALMDTLVKAGVLKDDSALNPEIVVSTDGSRVIYDKENPRIEVEIEGVKKW